MTIKESLRDTLTQDTQILAKLTEELDYENTEALARELMNCKGMIYISGCGTSGAAGIKIAHTLCCIDCPAAFLSPSNADHGEMGAVREGDIMILISNGGNTEEINSMIRPCRSRGAEVVAVTADENSPMAKGADRVLRIAVDHEPDDENILATGSIVAVIAVFDAIIISILRQKGFSRKEFLSIHPGGNVGKRLAESER